VTSRTPISLAHVLGGGVRVPSQDFSFGLIGDAIAAGKPVVITRSKERWIRAVSELARYRYYEFANPR
jgi:hypothetical protein